MLNKFYLFPLFGVLIPLVVYFIFSGISTPLSFSTYTIGDILDLDEKTATTSQFSMLSSDTFMFTGDVLMARNIEYLVNLNGFDYPFKNFAKIFNNSPVVIGNFESAMANSHKMTPSFNTSFSTKSEFLPFLKQHGFTHFTLANNHSLDFGQEGYENTVRSLLLNNLVPFGGNNFVSSSSVSVFRSGDYSIGLIGLNQIWEPTNLSDIENQLSGLETKTDMQIAVVHFGEEYKLKHNKKQEDFARSLIDIGFDAVVAHHPHVVQDIEIYNNRAIFYSLGNFLFDQYFSVDVQQGLVLSVNILGGQIAYNLIPVSSEGTRSQPYLMPSDTKAQFLTNLARRSTPAYAQDIKRGKLILPLRVASSSETSIIQP